MPLKDNSDTAKRTHPQIIFIALIFISLVLWFFYRALFKFPEIFDETLGKAIFFGAPILIFVNVIGDQQIINSMSLKKLFAGLLRGLAFGGLIGFATVIVIMLKNKTALTAVPLFTLDRFWWEFLLALLTAFWESLFFFGFIQTTIGSVFKSLKPVWQLLLVASLFLIFHLPNILLRFSGLDVSFILTLLFLFGLGQAIIFAKDKNVYTLILTHTIWGLVLMLHFF